MLRTIIFTLSLLFVPITFADTLYLGQISKHFKKDTEIKRERHKLVIYEWEDSGVLVGYWRNSYDRNTYAIGKRLIEKGTHFGNFGVKAGLATGYHYPIFGTLYYNAGYISINWIPTEVISAGLKFEL